MIVGQADSLPTCDKVNQMRLDTFDDTVARLKRFAAEHPRFMFSADSRSMILPYLTRTASLLRLPRPHWQYMGLFQRVSRAIG